MCDSVDVFVCFYLMCRRRVDVTVEVTARLQSKLLFNFLYIRSLQYV